MIRMMEQSFNLSTRRWWMFIFMLCLLDPQRKNPCYPLNRGLGAPQSHSGLSDEERNIPCLELNCGHPACGLVFILFEGAYVSWGLKDCTSLVIIKTSILKVNCSAAMTIVYLWLEQELCIYKHPKQFYWQLGIFSQALWRAFCSLSHRRTILM